REIESVTVRCMRPSDLTAIFAKNSTPPSVTVIAGCGREISPQRNFDGTVFYQVTTIVRHVRETLRAGGRRLASDTRRSIGNYGKHSARRSVEGSLDREVGAGVQEGGGACGSYPRRRI